MDRPVQLLDGLFDLVVLQLLLPAFQSLFIQLHGMGQADLRVFREVKFVLVHGVEAAVLHVAEGVRELSVLVNAPDEAHGKLVHNGIVHEQSLPPVRIPATQDRKSSFQSCPLGGDRGLDLLFHGLEILVSIGGLGIVGLAGGGHIFDGLALIVGDLKLQRCDEPNGEAALAVVEGPLAVLSEAQVRHDAVRQLLGGDAKLRSGIFQSLGGGGLDLTEFELPADGIDDDDGGGIAAEGQSHDRITGNGTALMLRPVVDGLGQPGGDGRAAVNACEGQDPLVPGLGPVGVPDVVDPQGQLFQVSGIQFRRKLGGGVAAPDAAQLAVGHQNGTADRIPGLGAVLFMERGQGSVQKPGKLFELVALDKLCGQIIAGADRCGLRAQDRADGIGNLGVLFGCKGGFQSFPLPQPAQHLHRKLPHGGLLGVQEGFAISRPFGVLPENLADLLPDLLGAVAGGGEDGFLRTGLGGQICQHFQARRPQEHGAALYRFLKGRDMDGVCKSQHRFADEALIIVVIGILINPAPDFQDLEGGKAAFAESAGQHGQDLRIGFSALHPAKIIQPGAVEHRTHKGGASDGEIVHPVLMYVIAEQVRAPVQGFGKTGTDIAQSCTRIGKRTRFSQVGTGQALIGLVGAFDKARHHLLPDLRGTQCMLFMIEQVQILLGSCMLHCCFKIGIKGIRERSSAELKVFTVMDRKEDHGDAAAGKDIPQKRQIFRHTGLGQKVHGILEYLAGMEHHEKP